MNRIAILTIFLALSRIASGQISGLGYLYPEPVTVAPGQVITVFIPDTSQNNLKVTVHQTADFDAPILDIRPGSVCAGIQTPCRSTMAITVQIPFEIVPTCFVCATPANFATQLIVTVNGTPGPTFYLTPLTDRIHLLTTCDTVVPSGSGFAPVNGLPCSPFITHGDGSLVTSQSPAHGDEELVAYAVGLGLTNPVVPTGQATAAAAPTQERFLMDFNYRANALPTQPFSPPLGVAALTSYAVPLFSGLAPGYIGLYQINFVVEPPSTSVVSCGNSVQSNLTVSVGGQFSFDGAGICVAPSQ
jgi:uncharacterized protein (TIGR03437 family)